MDRRTLTLTLALCFSTLLSPAASAISYVFTLGGQGIGQSVTPGATFTIDGNVTGPAWVAGVNLASSGTGALTSFDAQLTNPLSAGNTVFTEANVIDLRLVGTPGAITGFSVTMQATGSAGNVTRFEIATIGHLGGLPEFIVPFNDGDSVSYYNYAVNPTPYNIGAGGPGVGPGQNPSVANAQWNMWWDVNLLREIPDPPEEHIPEPEVVLSWALVALGMAAIRIRRRKATN